MGGSRVEVARRSLGRPVPHNLADRVRPHTVLQRVLRAMRRWTVLRAVWVHTMDLLQAELRLQREIH